jgi:hypothetical protein
MDGFARIAILRDRGNAGKQQPLDYTADEFQIPGHDLSLRDPSMAILAFSSL